MNTQIEAVIAWKSTINIFGYTGPNSIVEASGIRIFAKTASDGTGYFILSDLPISQTASEICLSAIDREERVSFPLCLPIAADKANIGPVILPPTVSLSSDSVTFQSKVYLNGQTVPNQFVRMILFPDSKSAEFSLISPAQALNKNLSGIFSDKEGKFSQIIPTDKISGYRVYVLGTFQNQLAGKSQTLYYYVNPITNVLIRGLLPFVLILTILMAGVLVLYFLKIKSSSGKPLPPWLAEKQRQLRFLWYNFRQILRKHQI